MENVWAEMIMFCGSNKQLCFVLLLPRLLFHVSLGHRRGWIFINRAGKAKSKFRSLYSLPSGGPDNVFWNSYTLHQGSHRIL